MELHQLTQHCYWSDPVAYGDRPSLGLIAGVDATLAVDTPCGCCGRPKGWASPRCGGPP